MTRYGTALTVAVACLSASSAQAFTAYKVNSGSALVDVLVDPLQTAESGNAFYDYRSSEAHPAFDLAGETLHIYLHENTTASGASALSIGYIFNTNVDNIATNNGSFEGTISGALASATRGVEDEKSELFGWDAADTFDGASTVNGDFKFVWNKNYTDGFTINNVGDSFWTINLDATAVAGVNNVVFLSGDATNPTVYVAENIDTTTFSITAFEVTSVPVPGSVLLLIGAVSTLVARRGSVRVA